MPVMFCNFNMFDVNSQVISVQEDGVSRPLFIGNFEEICGFMAVEYQTHKYDKIVLSGPYADTLSVRIRAYSRANYNFDDIKIEVI